MLVVVAIVLMLAALLLPVLEQAIRKSEATVCLGNVRSVAMAALLYADDYEQQLPPALVAASPPGYSMCWDRLLLPYLRTSEIYLCPSHGEPTRGPSWTYSLPHSYGINLDITLVGGYQGSSLRLDHPGLTPQTLLFFDLGQPYSYGWSATWGNLRQYVDERHNGGANFAFCGGHAKWLRAETTVQGQGQWLPLP